MTQKETVLYGLYVERIHRLAVDVAMQAAGFGEYGMGIAVVADECRTIGKRLYYAFESAEELASPASLVLLEELELLTLNGLIEALRIDGKERSRKTTKPLAVLFDEFRNVAEDLSRLLGGEPSAPAPAVPVLPRNTVFTGNFPYLLFTLGEQVFFENVEFVYEIVSNGQEEDGMLLYRGNRVPIIKAAALRGEAKPPKCYILLHTPGTPEWGDCVALPVEDRPCVLFGGMGVDTAAPEGLAPYVRACWSCEEEQNMLFLDYSKLV